MLTRVFATLLLVSLKTRLVLSWPVSTTAADRHVFSLTLTNVMAELLSSCHDFPDTLQININASHPFPQSFALHRKDVINTDPPAYVISSDNEGGVFVTRIVESEGTDTAAYQNEELGAAFIAKCSDEGFSIAGTLHVEGVKYRVFRHSAMTSLTMDYEFVFVNVTLHYDDILQAKRLHQMGSTTDNLDLDPLLPDTQQSTRVKRAAKDYYLDILVALDYAFYSYWLRRVGGNSTAAIQQAKEYVAYIFNEINVRYNTVANSVYRLHVVICGFIIAQTASESPWTETVKEPTATGVIRVPAVKVLEALEKYVKDNYQNLPPHDHLMLITEYDLYSIDNGYRFNNTAGYAKVGTMCLQDGSSVSVVEDHGGFQSETTATHELGHSLGAEHDGNGNKCNSSDRYVMAGGPAPITPANTLNPWRFSDCSAAYFQKEVAKLIVDGYENSCLFKRLTPVGVPVVTGYPGERAGPDDQCRQIYGASSYLCRGTKFGNPEDICLSMYCRNPSSVSTCTLNTAADGTCCGNKKWCVEGQCISSTNASCYMSSTCPFGQRQGVVFQNLTCDDLESGNCYNDDFRHVCCEMCDKKHTTLFGCEYGDRVRNCDVKYCGHTLNATGELYDVQCCGTCNHVVTTLTPAPAPTSTTVIPVVPDIVNTCRDKVLVNGLEECSTFITKTPGQCCKENVRTGLCCGACESARNHDDPLCPFGDCKNCTHIQSIPTPCTAELRASCCQTCKQVDLQFSTTTTTTSATSATTDTTTSPLGGSQTTVACKPIEGVRTCGVEGVGGSMGVVVVMVMVMFWVVGWM